jgi:amino-acid N-acetyltransferase
MTDRIAFRGSVRVATDADQVEVIRVLQFADRPLAGAPNPHTDFYVAEYSGHVVGAVGLEVHGAHALLRSVAVDPALQGTGVGAALITGILQHAVARGAAMVYVLTWSAEFYFHRFGFSRIGQDDVDESIRRSMDFTVASPAAAVVMRRELARRAPG